MTERTRAYCSVPGCLEPAEGLIELRYAHPQRNYLCAEHIKPLRVELARMLAREKAPA